MSEVFVRYNPQTTTYFKCPVGKETKALKRRKFLEDIQSYFPMQSTKTTPYLSVRKKSNQWHLKYENFWKMSEVTH